MIPNENLVYPIIDLVRNELSKEYSKITENIDPFKGTPSITLYRDHPLDSEKVTGVEMKYGSGYTLDVYLKYGSENEEDFPNAVDSTHPDYDYYRYWRLTQVVTSVVSPDEDVVVSYNIRLNYDTDGLLISTIVKKIEE